MRERGGGEIAKARSGEPPTRGISTGMATTIKITTTEPTTQRRNTFCRWGLWGLTSKLLFETSFGFAVGEP
eukprot:3876296-Pyramimonas_sp.AAC.1